MKTKGWIIGYVLLIAVVAVIYFLSPQEQEHTATVVEIENEVAAHPQPDDEWETAVPNMLIFGGGQVRTGADSWAKLTLPEGSVTLSAQTIFTVKESTTRNGLLTTILTLHQGRLWVHTATDQPHEFRVEAGSAVATVRDTRFSVRVADGETLLSVAEGEVTLTAQTQSITVAAGEQSIVEPEKPPSPPVPLSNAERILWATEGGLPELAPPTITPVPTPMPITAVFADAVVDFDQGSPGWVDFADPDAALGPPDMDIDPLYSGFVNLGIGGHLTVAFVDHVIVDGPGNDIRIHGDPESDEIIIVEVSADGETFHSFGEVPEMTDLDLADVSLSQASVIRIVDDGSSEQTGESAGSEIDAVEGLHLMEVGVGTAVIVGIDVYCSLSGPAGDLNARHPDTIFNVNVQTDDPIQLFVQMPNGDTHPIPQYGDLFDAEKRFHLRIPGLPQAGGTYTFYATDSSENPLPGAVTTDVYLGGNEPDPPTDVRGELVENGLLVRWEPSPIIPGAFNPATDPPNGFYQLTISNENDTVFGWNDITPLSETAHLFPYEQVDFGPGDRGQSLNELADGFYVLNLEAYSTAPMGSLASGIECASENPAEQLRLIIENGQVRVEANR